MILFLAALQRIPPTLYEAAAIDGAGRAGRSSGTSPSRSCGRPRCAVLLLLLINAFQAFDEFYNLLSHVGTYPPYARPPLVYLYYTALGTGQDFGHGQRRRGDPDPASSRSSRSPRAASSRLGAGSEHDD